jgi:hypothetical protein
MKRTRQRWVNLVLLACLVLASGCEKGQPVAAQSPEEAAAAAQRTQTAISETFTRAEQLLAGGDTNGALALLEAATTNQEFAAFHLQLSESLMQWLLRCDRLADARQRALASSDKPQLARQCCELVYRYYRNHGDTTNALGWAQDVATHKGALPEVRRLAYTWRVEDFIALQQDDDVLEALNQALQVIEAPHGLNLTRACIDSYFQNGRIANIPKILTLAAASKTSPANFTRLAVATQVRLVCARQDWPALSNQFQSAVNQLPDGELDALLGTVHPLLTASGQRPLLDQCVTQILFRPTASQTPGAVATAVRLWCENAMATDKFSLPSRLTALVGAKTPAAVVGNQFGRYYYAFSDDQDQLKVLMAVGEALIPQLDDEEMRSETKVKILDGCFLLQDFERAITILEGRIPGANRTEPWHIMAITKLKAHRALKQNQPREAVGFFREFMLQLRATKEPEIPDPVTNILHPKELILGRNAKRIGDILTSIPDATEAAKAYAEARNLYNEALKGVLEPAAKKIVEDEISQLPKTGGA